MLHGLQVDMIICILLKQLLSVPTDTFDQSYEVKKELSLQ